MGKWKKVMFVFILEVLRGEEGPRPESFWEVPKKRRRRPRLPKKLGVSLPEALPKKPEVSPSEAPEASALAAESGLDLDDDDMAEDEPPALAD
jgi:hypothetical protein